MELKTEIRGVEQTIAAFKKLPVVMRLKILKGATRAGMRAVRARAVQNIQSVVSGQATGLLAKSLSIYNGKQQGTKTVARLAIKAKARSARKPVRGWKKDWGRVGLYGSVLEFGKENQPPRPFLRPAAAQSTQQAVALLSDYISVRLAAAVSEASK